MVKNKKKLIIFMPSIEDGGVEKNLFLISNYLSHKINSITLRDTTSRWGSCTSNGRLMYSWRLVMAPREVQNYVAAHEVCHLIEMNHSNEYWQLVENVFPNYKLNRLWLKTNGNLLHQYKL